MRKYVFITILAAVLLCSCGGGGNWSGKMKTGDIHRVCDAVASWQMENFDRQPNGSDCFIADNQVHWSSAVLYSGMYRWAEYSGDERVFDFLRGIGDTNGWGLYSQRTPYHADDICVGQMYLDMYERYGGTGNDGGHSRTCLLHCRAPVSVSVVEEGQHRPI